MTVVYWYIYILYSTFKIAVQGYVYPDWRRWECQQNWLNQWSDRASNFEKRKRAKNSERVSCELPNQNDRSWLSSTWCNLRLIFSNQSVLKHLYTDNSSGLQQLAPSSMHCKHCRTKWWCNHLIMSCDSPFVKNLMHAFSEESGLAPPWKMV